MKILTKSYKIKKSSNYILVLNNKGKIKKNIFRVINIPCVKKPTKILILPNHIGFWKIKRYKDATKK